MIGERHFLPLTQTGVHGLLEGNFFLLLTKYSYIPQSWCQLTMYSSGVECKWSLGFPTNVRGQMNNVPPNPFMVANIINEQIIRPLLFSISVANLQEINIGKRK